MGEHVTTRFEEKHPRVGVMEWVTAWAHARGGPADGEKKRTCPGVVGLIIA